LGDWAAGWLEVVHISKLTIVIVVVTFETTAFVGPLLLEGRNFFLPVDGPLKLITDNAEKDNGLLLLQLLEKKWWRKKNGSKRKLKPN